MATKLQANGSQKPQGSQRPVTVSRDSLARIKGNLIRTNPDLRSAVQALDNILNR